MTLYSLGLYCVRVRACEIVIRIMISSPPSPLGYNRLPIRHMQPTQQLVARARRAPLLRQHSALYVYFA